MEFRVNMTVEVDQVANALAVKTPVPLQLVYQGGRWRTQCESPPVCTSVFDTMEEALVAGTKEVAAEVQGAVIDRPTIVGKITPNDIPANMF